MKKFDFPLFADTLFLFAAAGLLSLCLFRFYLPLAPALAAGICCGLAAAGLFFLLSRPRRLKKRGDDARRKEAEKLAFHLAMDAPENGAKLLAESINAAHEKRGETAPPARAERDAVIAGDARGFVRFRFEKVTADELSPFIRAEGAKKAVFAGAFTEEAKKLAEAFGLELFDADRVYDLVKEGGRMPQKLIAPPEKDRPARKEKRRKGKVQVPHTPLRLEGIPAFGRDAAALFPRDGVPRLLRRFGERAADHSRARALFREKGVTPRSLF